MGKGEGKDAGLAASNSEEGGEKTKLTLRSSPEELGDHGDDETASSFTKAPKKKRKTGPSTAVSSKTKPEEPREVRVEKSGVGPGFNFCSFKVHAGL